jgi:hypothetical protein
MIVIELKGGLVQSVYCDDPTLIGKSAHILDYDTDGGDENEFVTLPSGDDVADLRSMDIEPLDKTLQEFIQKNAFIP